MSMFEPRSPPSKHIRDQAFRADEDRPEEASPSGEDHGASAVRQARPARRRCTSCRSSRTMKRWMRMNSSGWSCVSSSCTGSRITYLRSPGWSYAYGSLAVMWSICRVAMTRTLHRRPPRRFSPSRAAIGAIDTVTRDAPWNLVNSLLTNLVFRDTPSRKISCARGRFTRGRSSPGTRGGRSDTSRPLPTFLLPAGRESPRRVHTDSRASARLPRPVPRRSGPFPKHPSRFFEHVRELARAVPADLRGGALGEDRERRRDPL